MVKNNIPDILKACVPLNHESAKPVQLYLENRGLNPNQNHPDLQFCSSLEYWDEDKKCSTGSFPCMVGILRDVEGAVKAVHRTYITEDGKKANVSSPKKILGELKGANLCIGTIGNVQKINITEGIENALAVHQATGLTTAAMLSATNLVNFVPNKTLGEVHICVDKDRKEAGIKNSILLAKICINEKIKVFMHIPPSEIPEGEKGIDWNDELKFRGIESISQEFLNAKEYVPHNTDKNLVLIADVQREEVEWLWNPYIPKGKITMLEGDPGLGKSFITLGLAAAVSKGGIVGGSGIMPNYEGSDISFKVGQGKVVLFCTEDGLGDTIRPRLEAMGANLENICGYSIPVVLDDEGKIAVENALFTQRPELLILDPLQAFMPPGSDMHRANHTRQFTSWLASKAQSYGCAILIVRHITKASSSQAVYRGLGSIDFTGAARSVLLVGRNPKDNDDRAIFHIKSNLAQQGHSIGYAVSDGRLEWRGVSSLDYETAFCGNPYEDNSKVGPSVIEEAQGFLREFLANGKKTQQEVEENAAQGGFKGRTLSRAKKAVGVKSIKDNSKDGVWYWSLGDQKNTDSTDETNND